jgi:hypothetical protein
MNSETITPQPINAPANTQHEVRNTPATKMDNSPIVNLESKIQNPKSEEIHESTTDTDALLKNVLDRLEPGSFRDNLHNQIIIDGIIDNKIKIIAINKVSEMLLKKAENITHIQKLFSEIL